MCLYVKTFCFLISCNKCYFAYCIWVSFPAFPLSVSKSFYVNKTFSKTKAMKAFLTNLLICVSIWQQDPSTCLFHRFSPHKKLLGQEFCVSSKVCFYLLFHKFCCFSSVIGLFSAFYELSKKNKGQLWKI